MEASEKIKGKLVQFIGRLITRCIEEARSVPYILDQQEAVDILLSNPALFERLVSDEQVQRTEYSKEKLTATLDAVSELGQFDGLNGFDMTFDTPFESDEELKPILDRINQLTRTFTVYIGNAATIFEKECAEFHDKFQQSMRDAGSSFQPIQLTTDDMAALEQCAASYAASGQFLQAVLFGRLLNLDVVAGRLVDLPDRYSLNENIILKISGEPALAGELVRFILRACYISQGGWEDLFAVLVTLTRRTPETISRSLLIEAIGRDIIFACNFLCASFADLKSQPPEIRTAAIESRLDSYGR
jgi:adenylate cyclase class IV